MAIPEELKAADRPTATSPFVADLGDVPSPCKPETDETKGEEK